MSKKNKRTGIQCQSCIEDMRESIMVPTGKVFMTNPAKREWKCPVCGCKMIVSDTNKVDGEENQLINNTI